ncbi:MAG: hypothetical protein QXF26_05905, partial [Candidatus Bathyarchaeia archaeon]
PLVDRPFTTDAYFIVRSLSYPDLWEWWFTEDTPGAVRLYLPKNTRCSFAYQDDDSGYILFVKNVLIKKVNATVTFDASKTGLISPRFIAPTSNIPIDYWYLRVGGKDLPTAEVYSNEPWGETVAVTLGKYDMYVWLRNRFEEGGFKYDFWFKFDLGQQTLSKKTKEILYGGDLKGFAKPSKNYYKAGETVKIDYWHEDAYKHKLVSAYTVVYDENWSWVTSYYPPLNLTICDDEGVVESEVLEWYDPTDTLYLYTMSVFAPGRYTVRIEYTPEPYQGAIVSSTPIVVK